jgi:hypothetical protein
MKMRLRYFGKDVQLTTPPRVENHPEPLERIEGGKRDFLTYTEQDFVFDTEDGRTLRLCRIATDKPLRDDPPVEVLGCCGAKKPLADPPGLAVAIYADGSRENVTAKESRNPYQAMADAKANKRKRVGRVNGKKGGRPPEPGVTDAARDAAKARLGNKSLSMKAACVFQISEHKLSIGWRGLEKHVKKTEGRMR